MAHKAQQEWCKEIKRQFHRYFKNNRVLDIGSLDINGNNRHLFDECEYIGLDVIAGKNVDVVSIAHEYESLSGTFDVILSTNALEHDMYYDKTLQKMVELLKPLGLLFFSAAHKWEEHGTLRKKPQSSGTTKFDSIWAEYYYNLTLEDIEKSISPDSVFKPYQIKIVRNDLRFWGIKKENT